MYVSDQLHKDDVNAAADDNETTASRHPAKKAVENNNDKEVDQLKDLPVMNHPPNLGKSSICGIQQHTEKSSLPR